MAFASRGVFFSYNNLHTNFPLFPEVALEEFKKNEVLLTIIGNRIGFTHEETSPFILSTNNTSKQ